MLCLQRKRFGSQRLGRNLGKVRKSRLYLQSVTDKDTVSCLRGRPPRELASQRYLLGIPGSWNFIGITLPISRGRLRLRQKELVQDCTAVRERELGLKPALLTPESISSPSSPNSSFPGDTVLQSSS